MLYYVSHHVLPFPLAKNTFSVSEKVRDKVKGLMAEFNILEYSCQWMLKVIVPQKKKNTVYQELLSVLYSY